MRKNLALFKISATTKNGETNIGYNNNYLITESEVVTVKSQTEALPYLPSNSEVNTVGWGLIFSRKDRTVEVIKLFIIWHQQQK